MRWAALILIFALAACAPVYVDDPMPTMPLDQASCGADDMQHLVGLPDDILERMRLKPPARILRPGKAATMDYIEERLNIDIDKDGVITNVYCG